MRLRNMNYCKRESMNNICVDLKAYKANCRKWLQVQGRPIYNMYKLYNKDTKLGLGKSYFC